MRRAALLTSVGAALSFMACLVQAASLVPPWCDKQSAQHATLSADGQWILAVSDASQHALTLFNTSLEPVHRYETTTLDGKSGSRVGSVYDAAVRHSFVVTLPDIAEIWEISYDPKAEPIYDGLVHDYRMGEGLARPGYFGVRRTRLATPLTALHFTPDDRTVIGIFTAKVDAPALWAHVIQLDIRREIATVRLSTLPDLEADLEVTDAGTTWRAVSGARKQAATHAVLARYCRP